MPITNVNTTVADVVLEGASGDESQSMKELSNLGEKLADKLDPVLNALLAAIEDTIVTDEVTADVQTLVNTINAEVLEELTDTETQVDVFRALLKSIIDTALLDSSYQILSFESGDITTEIDNFITRRTAEINQESTKFMGQDLNELIANGTLDPDIGAETLNRTDLRKQRLLLEMNAQAEVLRAQRKGKAYDSAINRERTKIQAGTLLPVQLLRLPPEVYDVIAELVRRRFLDKSRYVQLLPALTANAVEGLKEVGKKTTRGSI